MIIRLIFLSFFIPPNGFCELASPVDSRGCLRVFAPRSTGGEIEHSLHLGKGE
jgi:hypothetical protein